MFSSPVVDAFRALPGQEREAVAELKALEADLPAAVAGHMRARVAREAVRAEEAAAESAIAETRAQLAALAPGDPKVLALAAEIVRAESVVLTIRGVHSAVGRIDPLLVAENSALSARQDLERRIAAVRDRVENIQRLRRSDVGNDVSQLEKTGSLPRPLRVEKIRATNLQSEDVSRNF